MAITRTCMTARVVSCAALAGVLGACSRKYAHRIPFLVKINHNELLTYPNKFDQIQFGSVEQAYDLGKNPMLQYGYPSTIKNTYVALEVKF
jgi:class I fructose-bisphosphate aldolase